MAIDEIPQDLTTDLQPSARPYDVSNTINDARAWSILNNAAQTGGMFGPGVPVMPMIEESEPRWELYNPGVNLNILPRSGWNLMSFQQLRNIAAACKEVRLNIELIKRTIRGFDWEISPVKDDHAFDSSELDTFFAKPDGVHDLKGWIEIILEDLLVLDAVAIWPHLKGNRMVAAEPISADTIRINIDFRGRPAFPPAPAYFQVLWGVPRMWTTSDRIIYSMMHPRAYVPYGKPAIEDIVASINVSIRRELQRIGYYTEGNVPHSFVGLPSTWTVDQIKEYQNYVDTLVKGNESRTTKFIFIPHDGANIPVSAFQTNDLDGTGLDEHLMKVACWAFGNSPAEFGITGGKGLGGAGFMEGMEGVQFRTGIDPIVHFLQDFVTHIIQYWLRRPDAKFVVVGTEPKQEQLLQAQIDQLKLQSQIYTVEYIQDRDGVDQQYRPATTPSTPPPTTPTESNDEDKATATGGMFTESMLRAAARGLKVDLNQWQDTALRFQEKGWTMKPNTSSVIPAPIKAEIEAGLKKARTADDIRAVFDVVFARIKNEEIHKVFGHVPLKKRHTMQHRTEQLLAAWKKSEKRVADEILPVMQRYKKRMELMLRKADTPPQQSPEDRERFKREFIAALLLALGLAVHDLGDVENDVWSSHDLPRIAYSASEIISAYQERTGRPLSEIVDGALDGIQKEIDAWYGSGASVDELMDKIDSYLDLKKATDIGATEVGNIVSQLSLTLMNTYQMEDWIWRHFGEDVPCQNPIVINGVEYGGCLELEGKRFHRNDPMPPDASHPNCVLPGQVISVPGLLAGTKSFYSGNIVEVQTISGSRIAVTPNHPILTRRGWVSAKELNERDQVIRHASPREFGFSVYPDYHHVPTMIEQIFRSLEMSRFVAAVSMPVSPIDFHGDGRRIQGNINVVYPNRELMLTLNSHGLKSFAQGDFIRRYANTIPVSGNSRSALLGAGNLSTSDGLMSSLCVSQSLLGGHVGIPEMLGLRETSQRDMVFGQSSTDHNSRHSNTFGQSQFGFAGLVSRDDFSDRQIGFLPRIENNRNTGSLQVSNNSLRIDAELTSYFLSTESRFIQLDEIRQIRHIPFSGHVYDLQSVYGLYTCNGIITHNCHCLPEPIHEPQSI